VARRGEGDVGITQGAHRGPLADRLAITPRLTGVVGFDWGPGFFINMIPPEQAARALRGVSEEGRD
jgi:hypothetical protein